MRQEKPDNDENVNASQNYALSAFAAGKIFNCSCELFGNTSKVFGQLPFLLCNFTRFAAVLHDHPNIEVVVSSDWRKNVGSVAELAEKFDLDVRHQFIGLISIESGATESLRFEREYWQWLLGDRNTHGCNDEILWV